MAGIEQQGVTMLEARVITEVVLAPRYKYADVSSGAPAPSDSAPLFTRLIRIGKNQTYKMARLKKAAYVAAKSNGSCDNSNFGNHPAPTADTVEITGFFYDMSGDLCVEDFEVGCNQYVQSTFQYILDPSSVLNKPQIQAILGLHLETMIDDIARYALFAKTGFAVDTSVGAAPYYVWNIPLQGEGANAVPIPAARIPKTIGSQDGFWAQCVANVALSITPFVTTNDGTTAGNAINPANIDAFLRRMVDAAPPSLQFSDNPNPALRPFFLLDSALFDALNKYYNNRNTDTGDAHNKARHRTLQWDGYTVYRDTDARVFDSTIGAIKTSTIGGVPVTHSRNLRALFAAPRSAALALDVAQQNDPTVGILVQPAPGVKGRGKLEYLMGYTLGVGIPNPENMVVGWADSQTFQ